MSIDTLHEYYERQLRSEEENVEPLTDEELERLADEIDKEDLNDDKDEFEEEEL